MGSTFTIVVVMDYVFLEYNGVKHLPSPVVSSYDSSLILLVRHRTPQSEPLSLQTFNFVQYAYCCIQEKCVIYVRLIPSSVLVINGAKVKKHKEASRGKHLSLNQHYSIDPCIRNYGS